MLSDIEIAQAAEMKPITEIAGKLGLQGEDIIPYGHYKAKLNHKLAKSDKPEGKLILVTAISPTPMATMPTINTCAKPSIISGRYSFWVTISIMAGEVTSSTVLLMPLITASVKTPIFRSMNPRQAMRNSIII